MGDNIHTAPLISHNTDKAEPSPPPPQLEEKPFPRLDSAIERCIGDFGWSQLTQATLVSLSWFFDAQQTFVSVFTDFQPEWHCRDSTCTPGASDICQLPASAWAWDEGGAPTGHVSTVSEWALQCATPFLRGLPASAFFVGCLIGGILLATLADSTLGRRKMLLFSCLAMCSSAFVTAFSRSLWEYAALRFICGFARATIGTCALVLSTELVGKRWRGTVGLVGFFGFSLGFLSLPALAYANRGSSWRNIYLWTSLPGILYCFLIYFFVLESPRWLFVRGRKEEAIRTLKSIAPSERHTQLTASFYTGLAAERDTSCQPDADLYSAIKLLIEKRWALQRLCSVMAVGFGIGVVYYGMPLGIGNLSFNLYLGVAFNALSELPSTIISLFLVAKFNRRICLIVLTAGSGICSGVVCFLTTPYLARFQMVFELISFASGCAALCILLIYALELFPTCVRNSAVSMVRQSLVLGGVFGPMLVAAGKDYGAALSYGVFGAVIGCSGMFVACLPETRGGALCDTMEEEEQRAMSAHNDGAGCNVYVV